LGIVFTGNLKHELLIIQHVNESALHQTSRIAEENSECYQKRQRSEITESNRSYLVENESILSRHSQTHIPVSHLPPESYLEKSKDFVPSDFNLSTVKICRTDCGEEIPFSEFSFCIPIFAEVEYTNADIGRWGESLVYQYLLYAHPNENITWINRESETRAFYDITIVSKRNKGLCCTRFVEVKTTRYCDRNVFQISPWEYDFLSSHPRPNYDIYRVYGAPGTSFVKPRLVIYKDIYTLIQEKKINLCLAV
jgi:hypothetical protein